MVICDSNIISAYLQKDEVIVENIKTKRPSGNPRTERFLRRLNRGDNEKL